MDAVFDRVSVDEQCLGGIADALMAGQIGLQGVRKFRVIFVIVPDQSSEFLLHDKGQSVFVLYGK